MRVNKIVASLWMASAAIFGLGVFLMAQSAIGPLDVAKALDTEAVTPLEYQAAIRETTAQKPQAKGPVAAKDAAPDMKSATASDVHGTMPLPAKKEGGPDQWVKVAGTDAVMRSEPAAGAPMIVAFPVGRKLFVQDEKDGWTKVEEPKTSTVGWIQADQLAKPGEMRMARLGNENRPGRTGPALDESESAYSDDWAMEVEETSVRHERRRGPLGGILRRAFGGL
ncbi:SH3 domain-containing protein [Methyloligella solikamskensis]|uniref:SH3 domain-containing protein n=1 Tax=Methyloligella solikamskensis TaxID=1177756 RepID=A0ABW3J9Q4_9HYPH